MAQTLTAEDLAAILATLLTGGIKSNGAPPYRAAAGWSGITGVLVTEGAVPDSANVTFTAEGANNEQAIVAKHVAGQSAWVIDPASAMPFGYPGWLVVSITTGADALAACAIRFSDLVATGYGYSGFSVRSVLLPAVPANTQIYGYVHADGKSLVPKGSFAGNALLAAAAGTRAALGMAAANLDTQLALTAKEATVLGQFGVTYGITYPLVRRDGIINLSRGDVATLAFTLGASFPLAGKKVYFCAQKRKAETNTTAIVNRVATITDEAARTCTITLTAAELATAGQYLYEIEVRNTDESIPQTAEAGTLNIIDDLRK